MKRILLALATLALLWPSVRPVEAADVSIDFFYNNLGNDGSWIEVGDYGYCWQPGVAVSNPHWRPYSDGYWAYTDVGWTWVSYEDFGWATYHYGRWARLHDRGWVWVPGYEWGPAWVSWRTGGNYVGWAPLPPHRGGGGVVYAGGAIGPSVDLEFDIGPLYYNFVDVHYIGEPVLRERIFRPDQNIAYMNQTVNVTNITYDNSVVRNYGPDFNQLNQYSSRKIARLNLERQNNADYNAAVRSGQVTRVKGDKLLVAAPMTVQKPPQPVAPKNVKGKVEKPDLESGWSGINDPKAKAELQQKMKTEDPKKVPPMGPDATGAGRGLISSPDGTPVPDQGDKNKKGAGANAQSSGNIPNAVAPNEGNGKGKKSRVESAPMRDL